MESIQSYLQQKVRFHSDKEKEVVHMMDFANVLGLPKNSRDITALVWREYRTRLPDGVGKPSWWVNESGIYQMIFASEQSKAVEIQRWIFEEVLPAIRRDGAFIDEHRITDPQLAKVSNRIKQMQQERLAARKSWTDQVKKRLIKDGLYHTTDGTGKVITTHYSRNVFRSLTVEVNEVLFNRRHFYCDRSAFMEVDQQEIITQFEIELAASAREYPDEPIEKIVALALDKILEVQQT